jgi:fatty acid-binding protein DegV
MIVGKKYRGSLKKCIKTYIENCLENNENIDPKRCFITHTIKDRSLIEFALHTVNEHFKFDEILETHAGSTIASHCGEGTLGILFFRKTPVNIF